MGNIPSESNATVMDRVAQHGPQGHSSLPAPDTLPEPLVRQHAHSQPGLVLLPEPATIEGLSSVRGGVDVFVCIHERRHLIQCKPMRTVHEQPRPIACDRREADPSISSRHNRFGHHVSQANGQSGGEYSDRVS